MKYIEISQDGAAVIGYQADKPTDIALGTLDVASCSILVFEGEVASVIVHDTGQLSLASLAALVAAAGKISAWRIMEGRQPYARHSERYYDMQNQFSLPTPTIEHSMYLPAMVAYSRGHGFKDYENVRPSQFEGLPEREKRNSINEVNNLFAEKDEHEVVVDLQWQVKYTELPSVNLSISEILETMRSQPKYFFLNLAFVGKAHENGALTLPDVIVELYKTNNIEQYKYRTVSVAEKDKERIVFEKFCALVV